jgi:hypothetical protein
MTIVDLTFIAVLVCIIVLAYKLKKLYAAVEKLEKVQDTSIKSLDKLKYELGIVEECGANIHHANFVEVWPIENEGHTPAEIESSNN